jgi:hypothetical protein
MVFSQMDKPSLVMVLPPVALHLMSSHETQLLSSGEESLSDPVNMISHIVDIILPLTLIPTQRPVLDFERSQEFFLVEMLFSSSFKCDRLVIPLTVFNQNS